MLTSLVMATRSARSALSWRFDFFSSPLSLSFLLRDLDLDEAEAEAKAEAEEAEEAEAEAEAAEEVGGLESAACLRARECSQQ